MKKVFAVTAALALLGLGLAAQADVFNLGAGSRTWKRSGGRSGECR